MRGVGPLSLLPPELLRHTLHQFRILEFEDRVRSTVTLTGQRLTPLTFPLLLTVCKEWKARASSMILYEPL
jgi:hypothetical protein